MNMKIMFTSAAKDHILQASKKSASAARDIDDVIQYMSKLTPQALKTMDPVKISSVGDLTLFQISRGRYNVIISVSKSDPNEIVIVDVYSEAQPDYAVSA